MLKLSNEVMFMVPVEVQGMQLQAVVDTGVRGILQIIGPCPANPEGSGYEHSRKGNADEWVYCWPFPSSPRDTSILSRNLRGLNRGGYVTGLMGCPYISKKRNYR